MCRLKKRKKVEGKDDVPFPMEDKRGSSLQYLFLQRVLSSMTPFGSSKTFCRSEKQSTMSVSGEQPSDIELRAMYKQAIVKGKELFDELRRNLLPKDFYCTKDLQSPTTYFTYIHFQHFSTRNLLSLGCQA